MDKTSNFTIVVVYDLQGYAQAKHLYHYYTDIAQDIINKKDSLNIKLVIYPGDIVNKGGVQAEWEAANAGFDLLDKADIPYTISAGNHDYKYPDSNDKSRRDTTNYDFWLGPDRFSGYNWYGGGFPPGSNRNMYVTFKAGGLKWIALGLQWGPTNEDITWAENIILKNPDKYFILYDHSYLFPDSTRSRDPGNTQQPSITGPTDNNDGEETWTKLVSKYNNIVIYTNGHYTDGGDAARRVDIVNGEPINQIFFNPQNWANWGDGYYRYYTFTPNKNTIDAYTYSPTLNNYLTTDPYQFTLDFRSKAEEEKK